MGERQKTEESFLPLPPFIRQFPSSVCWWLSHSPLAAGSLDLLHLWLHPLCRQPGLVLHVLVSPLPPLPPLTNVLNAVSVPPLLLDPICCSIYIPQSFHLALLVPPHLIFFEASNLAGDNTDLPQLLQPSADAPASLAPC